MKRYNTPHRHRVIKTRLTEEEYAEFSERVTLCKMSQAEFIRQALIKSSIRPVITVSPVNDELLSAVGKLTAEYGKIGGNLNQIARCLNEYGKLEAALLHRADRKRCTECGGYFLPKSNRGKYCPNCAGRMKRIKAAQRKRKQRDKCHALGYSRPP